MLKKLRTENKEVIKVWEEIRQLIVANDIPNKVLRVKPYSYLNKIVYQEPEQLTISLVRIERLRDYLNEWVKDNIQAT